MNIDNLKQEFSESSIKLVIIFVGVSDIIKNCHISAYQYICILIYLHNISDFNKIKI